MKALSTPVDKESLRKQFTKLNAAFNGEVKLPFMINQIFVLVFGSFFLIYTAWAYSTGRKQYLNDGET